MEEIIGACRPGRFIRKRYLAFPAPTGAYTAQNDEYREQGNQCRDHDNDLASRDHSAVVAQRRERVNCDSQTF